MSRMLKALQQLEVKSPQPPQVSRSLPPEQAEAQRKPRPEHPPQADRGIASGAPTLDDAAIQAAFNRVETAAEALRQEPDLAPASPSTTPPPSQPAPPQEPAYRELAESVLAQVPTGRPTALMFTSPSDGEGKTELLVSLAAALAQRSPHPLLLLDGNLHSPNLARCLGVSATRGLAQVLMGATSWQHVVQRTAIPHLDLLPGVEFATPDVRLPERLNLRPLLDQLRAHYRLVLIDTASLAHPEVAPIAADCDGTYLVVRLMHTARRDLARAVQVIQACRGHLLGSVVIGA